MQYPVQNDIHARLRLDKWLWAARFFKTRSLATDAVNKGRATLNGAAVKPARDVRVGDQVRIELDGLAWEIEVLGICEVRGPAVSRRACIRKRRTALRNETRSWRGASCSASRPPRCTGARPSATAAKWPAEPQNQRQVAA